MVPILTLPALADGATAFRDTDAAGSATRRELMARRLKERLFPRNRRACLTGRWHGHDIAAVASCDQRIDESGYELT